MKPLIWILAFIIGLPQAAVASDADTYAPGTVIEGPFYISDGDTGFFQNPGQRRVTIRFPGIDTHETSQVCEPDGKVFYPGVEATRFALSVVHGKTVRCTSQGRGGYGRVLGTCVVDGKSLEETLVAGGWALDSCRDPDTVDADGNLKKGKRNSDCYSRGRYREMEAEARAAKRGLWARDSRGVCEPPWVYRRRVWG